MKTTLDIPDDILAEAMRVCGARTKREAVIRALEDLNRRAKLQQLTKKLGKSETFMDFDELMKVRGKEIPGGDKQVPS